MPYEILEETPYRGEIHIVTTPADLDALPLAGRKLLTVYQLEQFRDFPGALLTLAETADLPYVAAWLRALAQAEACQLEVCLTEYAKPQVFVRYTITEKWTPALLRQVYALVGKINFEGYGYAGGLLCPRTRTPILAATTSGATRRCPTTTALWRSTRPGRVTCCWSMTRGTLAGGFTTTLTNARPSARWKPCCRRCSRRCWKSGLLRRDNHSQHR
jgi:hypothetical protein